MGEFMRNHLPLMGLIASLITVVWTVVLTLLTKTYARREDLDEVRTRMLQVEATLKSLPTVEQFHRVEIAVSELSGDIKEIKAAVKAIGHTNSLLLEKHLTEKD